MSDRDHAEQSHEALRDSAKKGLASFWFFHRYILQLDFVRHFHGELSDTLERGDWDEMIVATHRGTFKTTLGSAYVAWRIVQDRNFRCKLLTDPEEPLGWDIIGSIEGMLENPRVVSRYRSFVGEEWARDKFTVSGRTRTSIKESTMMVTGRKNFTPGGHCDLFWMDDFDNQDTVKNETIIAKTREIDSLAWPMTDEPGAKRLATLTFWSDDDIGMFKIRNLGLCRTERGRTIMENGTRSEDGRALLFYKPLRGPDGEIQFVERFDEQKVARLKKSMTASTFSAQYDLDPITGDDRPFKAEDFKYGPDPGWRGERFVGIDPSQDPQAGSCPVGVVTARVSPDYEFFVESAREEKFDGRELLEMMFSIQEIDPDVVFCVEEDGYMRGLKNLLSELEMQRRLYLRIEWIKANSRKNKDERIVAGAQTLLRYGKIVIAHGEHALESEGTRFPLGKKDALDALVNIIEFSKAGRGEGEERSVKQSPFDKERAGLSMKRVNDPRGTNKGANRPWLAS